MEDYLQTKVIGRKIIRYDSVESTNSIAKEMVRKGAEEGAVVLAKVQTKGRGRKDRRWHSPEGGLWFSVTIYPELQPDQAMLVTMTASIAITEGISSCCDIKAYIKWPNDVLIDNQKVAGVLTELHADKEKLHHMVVGVGVNANNRLPAELRERATTLQRKKGSEVDKEQLFSEILRSMDRWYGILIDGRYDEIRAHWLERSSIIGKNVRIHEHGSKRTATVNGIDDKGRLLVDINGEQKVILTGDIELL